MTVNVSMKKQRKQPTILTIEVLIGLATGPVLVALVGSKVLAGAVCELGQMSEEFFRGDRLPLLKFPPTSDPTTRIPDAD